MNKTKIEFCDSTWNPVTGCLYGCTYCYARRMAKRFGGHAEKEGLIELERKQDTPYPYDFYPTFHAYRLEEPKQHVKPQTIFVCSMADLFGGWIPDQWIQKVLQGGLDAPQHNYLFLTKNPQRYAALDQAGILLPNSNMWYGFSMTGTQKLPWWINHDFNVYSSIEPLLGRFSEEMLDCISNIQWVIIGAETGSNKNKITPKKEWIDEIVETCKRHEVAVFMKSSIESIMGAEHMLRELPKQLQRKGK